MDPAFGYVEFARDHEAHSHLVTEKNIVDQTEAAQSPNAYGDAEASGDLTQTAAPGCKATCTSCRYIPEAEDAPIRARELVTWIILTMLLGLGAFCAVLLTGGTPPETPAEAFAQFAPWLVFAIAAILALGVLMDHTAKLAVDVNERSQVEVYEATKRWLGPRQAVVLAGVTMGYALGALAYLATLGLALVAVIVLVSALSVEMILELKGLSTWPSRMRIIAPTLFLLAATVLMSAWLFPWLRENPPNVGVEDNKTTYTCTSEAGASSEPSFACTESND